MRAGLIIATVIGLFAIPSISAQGPSGLGKFTHQEPLNERYSVGRCPYFGVRISGGYAYPSHVRYARIPLAAKATGPDFAISGLFHVPFGNRFFIEPQAELYYNLLKTDHRIYEEPAAEGVTEAKLRTVGVRVPIYAGLRFGTGRRREFTIFGGPQFDFRIHTAFRPNVDSEIFHGSTARPLYGDYGVDLDLRGGIGYSVGHIFIGATYTWGIAHITRSDYGAKQQRMAQLSVGYDF